jgi:predicted Zn finger-like uncharacterized protein
VYTQCSKCETVFKLSAETLRAAGGQVRCGKCGEVFNALARLAEDSNAFETGESPLDLEARADSILETIVEPQVARAAAKDYEDFAPPGVEIAQLEVLDWTEEDQARHQNTGARGVGAGDLGAQDTEARSIDVDDASEDEADRSMEFTLPPGELDRIFVESKKPAGQSVPQPASQPAAKSVPQPASQPAAKSVPQPASQPAAKSVPQPASQPAAKSVPQPAPRPVPVPQSMPQPGRQPVPPAVPEHALPPPVGQLAHPSAPDSADELPPHPESAVANAVPVRNRISGLEVPEHVRRDMLEGFEQHLQPAGVVRNGSRRGALRRPLTWWLGAAIVSTLLLITQIIQQNREWFIAHAHGPLGAGVRALYGALGAPLPAPANLSAYQLRQWGATGDPDANGTLRLRASILNAAAQLQPYPLLRVTLADRFGKGIGRRDFEPGEYLGKPTARLLAPGERVDATLEILDPGKNAEGFEIDVCLRGIDQRIACQGDVAPQVKR